MEHTRNPDHFLLDDSVPQYEEVAWAVRHLCKQRAVGQSGMCRNISGLGWNQKRGKTHRTTPTGIRLLLLSTPPSVRFTSQKIAPVKWNNVVLILKGNRFYHSIGPMEVL